MISRREIATTRARIARHIRQTPTIQVSLAGSTAQTSLKLECLQHSGSFKVRGAFANMLSASIPAAGVTAASGGNHGAAVAYAASVLGAKATIFVPAATPSVKVSRIRNYGAHVIVEGGNYSEALTQSAKFAEETGALAIHAYDTEPTILGQGTIGQEFEEQAPDLDSILVAIGGGGLIAGVASWYAGGIKVVGIETEGCPTFYQAKAFDKPVEVSPAGIAVDSLGASRAGTLAFATASAHLHSVLLVSDRSVRDAQRWLWENLRIVTEPGGAVAFSALLSGAYRPQSGELVGILVCGANIDLGTFAQSIETDA